MTTDTYEFAFRGLLAQAALDRAGRGAVPKGSGNEAEIQKLLPFELLDIEYLQPAQEMSRVFCAIAAFEKSVRAFVAAVLSEAKGETWMDFVPEKVRARAGNRMLEEEKFKWHSKRGGDLINYITFSDLSLIIKNNHDIFEAYTGSNEWASQILDTVERSRNVIMHSGILDKEDVARIGMNMRDWIRQVGA